MLNSFGIIIDTLAYSENQVINIIDIKAVEKEKGIRIPKVSPILIKITN